MGIEWMVHTRITHTVTRTDFDSVSHGHEKQKVEHQTGFGSILELTFKAQQAAAEKRECRPLPLTTCDADLARPRMTLHPFTSYPSPYSAKPWVS